ncbi:MAG TPA: hypothetical protein P5075_03500 [Eubacteriales bacterium]|nr:hypothetical protein [Eubacteriales bacterium]
MSDKNTEIRVKFEIGDIKFEAEGSADLVERERSIFTTTLLPSAVEAIVRTRGVAQTTQYIEATEQPAMLLTSESNGKHIIPSVNVRTSVDLSKTSLSSFIIDFGRLSDRDFVLVAAYFDEKKNGIRSFTSESVKQYYADARRRKYSNNSDLLQRLVQKGYIMDDPNAEKKIPKSYILTDTGVQYIETYQPKSGDEEKPKPTKPRKVRSKKTSVYNSICADDLNLKNYPEIKIQDSFKKQMMLLLYIVTNEGKGDNFTVADVEYLLTSMMGLPSTKEQIKGVFKRNKVWFKPEQDDDNKYAYRYRLLQGAKDFAQSIIDGNAE